MKIIINRLFILIICQFLLVSSQLYAEEKHEHTHERESCKVCGMWIDQYLKSAAILVHKDGSKEYSCGVACMLRIVEDEGGIDAFESVQVHDWASGRLVNAVDATYVLGSNVIPDMVPNYIAFANRSEAEAFVKKEGGEVINFNIAFDDISPVGTTAPFRIRTAVTPGKGNFSAGVVYGYTQRDNVFIGSNSMDPGNFIEGNAAQPRAPSEFIGHQQSLVMNYSPTNNLALFLNIPWFERATETLNQTSPGKISETRGEGNSLGDIALEGRYNLWRTTHWDKFVSVLLGVTLPTGRFNGARSPTIDPVSKTNLISTSPALQFGKDVPTFTGGLLYSQRWNKFWLHASGLYNVNPENDKDFAFGDVATGGLALHYTPHYDLMLGVEVDVNHALKNEDRGYKVGNSGGTVTNLAFVSDWRFLNAFGGNFRLRGSVGLPIQHDLNSTHVVLPGRQFNQVQLGGGFFANMAIQWTFRAAPY
jgi:nitrous oxide reductase accessory protein NosL